MSIEARRASNRKSYHKYREARLRRNKERRALYRAQWMDIIHKKFGDQIGCCTCGYDKYFEALDAHHVNSVEKEFNLSDIMRLKPTEERVKELDKVKFYCATHHRELHIEHKHLRGS